MHVCSSSSHSAAVSNHPVMLSIPAEIEAIQKPVQFNVAEIDAVRPDGFDFD